MDFSDVQVQNAIEIAWNPTSDQNLKAQAFDFIKQLRTNPSASQVCLSLFIAETPQSEVVRHVCLEVVNMAVQSGTLDSQNLLRIRDGLLQYLKGRYGNGARVDSPPIQNKLAQTLTYLFEYLYKSGWETFFDDVGALSGGENGSNLAGTLFYLRVLASVHDEIADQLINIAPEKARLFTELKDLIRARDVQKITSSWQRILLQRNTTHGVVVELCLKNISRWVSWTDISLVVNQEIMTSLFDIASQPVREDDDQATKIRDAAIDVFTEVVAKKMKPVDKVGLIQFMNLHEVVNRLTMSPGLNETRGGPDYDTDMAETVAKLVNGVVFDIVKILDTPEVAGDTRARTEQSLQQFVPHLLRFFSDEYDEVCSTVIPSLTDLLSLLRKLALPQVPLPELHAQMLRPILNAVIAKMRYDDTSSWGEEGEETDEAEFQELRKRLRVLQQLLATVDEGLYIDTLSNIIVPTLTSLNKSGMERANWRDVDLAMHEMSLLGELALTNGGLYHKKKPSSLASERLIQVMILMQETDVASFAHPAIHLQYMETCVRHTAFFQEHPQYIPRVLQHFVNFTHSNHVKVRARSYNFFLRLVRELKAQLGDVANEVTQAIQDLLIINAEVPDDASNDDSSSNEDSNSSDALFNSQLALFEAIGCMASAPTLNATSQASLAGSVLAPLLSGISKNLASATQGDERATLQIHHLIMACGTLARGFSDWVPGRAKNQVNEQVSAEFSRASTQILDVLVSLKGSMTVRTAVRFTFSRMIGVIGYGILERLPEWIDGLLAESSTKDEMAASLKLLDQIIYGFKSQIANVLDTLFTPLLQRIFAGLLEQTTGTDDEIQLGELRREYINFLLIILGNDLQHIFLSSNNEPLFLTIIDSLDSFARDTVNNPDARLSMAVLTKMSLVWGGSDIKDPISNATAPQPSLPGFDQFMMSRFSSLTWQIMSSATFSPKEANGNRVLAEIAVLQQTILAKTGQQYLSYLRDIELRNLGVQASTIDEYLHALISKDQKMFKKFLEQFLRK